LAGAIAKVRDRTPAAPASVILSGHGEFLAQAALATLPAAGPTISLTEKLGLSLSRCAPAHALAVLAREAWAQ
jgi:uncharacterized hydantoinase/oxoprolinase family protein